MSSYSNYYSLKNDQFITFDYDHYFLYINSRRLWQRSILRTRFWVLCPEQVLDARQYWNKARLPKQSSDGKISTRDDEHGRTWDDSRDSASIWLDRRRHQRSDHFRCLPGLPGVPGVPGVFQLRTDNRHGRRRETFELKLIPTRAKYCMIVEKRFFTDEQTKVVVP